MDRMELKDWCEAKEAKATGFMHTSLPMTRVGILGWQPKEGAERAVLQVAMAASVRGCGLSADELWDAMRDTARRAELGDPEEDDVFVARDGFCVYVVFDPPAGSAGLFRRTLTHALEVYTKRGFAMQARIDGEAA